MTLEKTEGVPFFIEEFVRSWKDLKVLQLEGPAYRLADPSRKGAIPSNLHEVIMARVDALPERAKEILKTGSVIEREFTHELIRTITGLPEGELLRQLSTLKEAELLYERGIYPHSSYIFRHALTREVVYASILDRRRRELHGQIGAAIEELRKDDLAEHYEVLSEHFSQSEDYAKAAGYSKRAARKAEKSAFLPDAITHARKRVLFLEKLPYSWDGSKELIDARTTLGLYLNQLNHWGEAKEAVESVVRLARDKGYRKRLGQIQIIMGSYYGFIDEDFPKAFEAPAMQAARPPGGVAVLESPGPARVVDLTVGETQVVMIFDPEIKL